MPSESTLRALLQGLCEDPEHIEALMFTSFTFDPAFFEDNVLATLCNDGKRLATAQDLTIASAWADEHNLCVFHDSAMLTNPEQRATYSVFPINIEDGVFHPKIICALIGGEHPIVKLVVTSGNLSYAGWGHNREVFATHEVTDQAIAAPLITFIDWLHTHTPSSTARLAALRAHLTTLPNAHAKAPQLLVTLPHQNSTVMQRLANTQGTLTIASPFFHPALHTFLAANLPHRRIALVPAKRAAAEEVNILDAVITALNHQPSISFHALPRPDSNRHDHLKLYSWSGGEEPGSCGMILGSHNATEAALGTIKGPGTRKNVEISLLLPGQSLDLNLTLLTTPPIGVDDRADLDPDLTRADHLDIAISVNVDWRHDRFHIVAGRLPQGGELRLDLPGTSLLDVRLFEGEHVCAFEESSARALLSRKWFRVTRTHDGKQQRCVGLIHELHWMAARPDFALRSLEQCLDAWLHADLSDVRQAARVGTALAGREDGEAKLSMSHERVGGEDVFNNFFQLFRAKTLFLQKMQRREDELDETWARRAMACVKAAPDSLANVVRQTHERYDPEQHDGWDAYGFTLTAQLQQIMAVLHNDGVIADLEQGALAEELQADLTALSARWTAAIKHELSKDPGAPAHRALPMLYERITGEVWR